jgi:hypothetical protein
MIRQVPPSYDTANTSHPHPLQYSSWLRALTCVVYLFRPDFRPTLVLCLWGLRQFQLRTPSIMSDDNFVFVTDANHGLTKPERSHLKAALLVAAITMHLRINLPSQPPAHGTQPNQLAPWC